jgi:hypothetical protein
VPEPSYRFINVQMEKKTRRFTPQYFSLVIIQNNIGDATSINRRKPTPMGTGGVQLILLGVYPPLPIIALYLEAINYPSLSPYSPNFQHESLHFFNDSNTCRFQGCGRLWAPPTCSSIELIGGESGNILKANCLTMAY